MARACLHPNLPRLSPLWLALMLVLGCGSSVSPEQVSTGDAGTLPQDGGSATDAARPNPRPINGPRLPPTDDELELPFGGEPVVYRFEAQAALGVLDVQLSIDTTASFNGEIDALQRDLTRTILPGLRERVPDVSVGVARFEDFPAAPFGSEGNPPFIRADRPFELLLPISSDEDRITQAVGDLEPLGLGGDIPESAAEALWQIATGRGYELDDEILVEPYEPIAEIGGGVLGGVGFREGALRVVLHVTDAPTQSPESYGAKFPSTHSLDEASRALQQIQARVVSVVSGWCDHRDDDCSNENAQDARDELSQLALDTRAETAPDGDGKCPHGIDGEQLDAIEGHCPLVFDVSSEGEGLSATIVDAIASLVDGIRFERVGAFATDDPLRFVTGITPRRVRDAPEIADLLPEGAPDGELDSFVGARAGAPLVFEIALQNTRIAPRAVAQSFRVVLRIFGDDLIVEERTLRVVVPAGSLPPPPADQDAGE